MSRFTRKSSKKAGSSPGTLVHVGERKTDGVHLALLHYDAETVIERPLALVEEVLPLLNSSATTWLNIDGIHDISLMEHIGRLYGIHPLTLEDVLNTAQRPKTEAFDDYLFIGAIFKSLPRLRGDLQSLRARFDRQGDELDRAALVGWQLGQAPMHAV